MITQTRYDEVRIDRFDPEHSYRVKFEQRATNPPPTKVKASLTRDEALYLLCKYVDQIASINSIASMGCWGAQYGHEQAYANERIHVLVKSGLISDSEVQSAYDQIDAACRSDRRRDPGLPQVQRPIAQAAPADVEGETDDDVPF